MALKQATSREVLEGLFKDYYGKGALQDYAYQKYGSMNCGNKDGEINQQPADKIVSWQQ